jgi:radical SAM superfamily enzyme YgiQ (UPF0313 family)
MKFSIITDQLCPLSKVNIGYFYEEMNKRGNDLIIDYMKADIIIFHPCRLVKTNRELLNRIKRKKIKVLFCYKKSDFDFIEDVEFVSHEYIKNSKNCVFFDRKDNRYIQIGSGCNRICAYCPIKREKTVSRPINDILQDTHKTKRITLCADECSSYKYGLINLLKKLPQEKIIISHIYPSYLIKHKNYFIKNKKKILIDILPMQSASLKVLKSMNRGDYDPEKVLDIINKIDVNSVHFIFGYPTETWNDFLETVSFENKMKKIKEKVFWFVYNTYEGTKSKETYGEKKNILIPSMKDYLLKKKRGNYLIIDFLDGKKDSIVIGLQDGKMNFYRAKDLIPIKGGWDKNDVYKAPSELLGKNL